MTPITESDVVQACQTLFGKDVDITRDFLSYVQPSGVKSAYRKKAKETHPDLFAADSPSLQQMKTILFREILRAYHVLTLFFKQREEGAWNPAPRVPRPHRRGREDRQTAPPSGTAGARQGGTSYFRGSVPFRTLQIGQYLYYRGKISFEALINALIWQRKQRPSLGDIALRWGLIDPGGIKQISGSCERPRRFGEKAVEMGLLTIFQVNTILLYQRSQQDRLGKYFILNQTLFPEELERLALELKEHNVRVLANSMPAGRNPGAFARSSG
jgi:hypothetical protein